jgi:5'-3' exonuclease
MLADLEETHMKNEAKQRDRRQRNEMPNITPEEKLKRLDSIPIYERSIERYINPFKLGWENRYYNSLFYDGINEDDKRSVCVNYLEGLEWTLKYYTTGCPNWRWSYKYHYPPLLRDLVASIPVKNDYEIFPSAEAVLPPKPVTDLVQLCYVLPKQSLQLLPPDVYKKLLEKHEDWYKTNCEFVWAYCRYFWESHVDLPEIDIEELERLIH